MTETETAAREDSYPRPIIAWATVAILFFAYIFSFIDRMIISLLVEPLKAEFNVTDTQIGLLMGPAFALFYTFAGLPIGRLIDRTRRLRVAGIGAAIWCAMTAASGMAGSFWQLFAARIGVGVGEATLSPAAYSVISDSFPKKRLGLAMGVYSLGSATGAGLAFLLGGMVVALVTNAGSFSLPLVGQLEPWRVVFIAVGLPGLLIAALLWMLPEPARKGVVTDGDHATLRDLFAFLKSRAGFISMHFLAVGMVNLAVFAAVSWTAVLFVRVHGFSVANSGYLTGAALIIGGMIGLIGGGWLSDKAGGSVKARMAVCGGAAVVGAVCAAFYSLVPNPWLAAFIFVFFFAAGATPIGVAAAALQQIAPNRMRATVSAAYLFVVNFVGLVIGPPAVAALADMMFPGEEGIRYSIAIISPVGYAVAIVCFFLAMRFAGED